MSPASTTLIPSEWPKAFILCFPWGFPSTWEKRYSLVAEGKQNRLQASAVEALMSNRSATDLKGMLAAWLLTPKPEEVIGFPAYMASA